VLTRVSLPTWTSTCRAQYVTLLHPTGALSCIDQA